MADTICLNEHWKIKRDGEGLTGEQLSSGPPSGDGWIDARVPGTVLGALVDHGDYPDPYIERNGEATGANAPDIFDVGRAFYTYWWVTRFELSDRAPGECFQLELRGVNYTAEIYLNGELLSAEPHKGMFLRCRIDVSQSIRDGENYLAVLVRPPENPGLAARKVGDGLNGQCGASGEECYEHYDSEAEEPDPCKESIACHVIGRDVTAQYVAGWDWMMPIRDRGTGLWDNVYLHRRGSLVIRDPYVKVTFPDAGSYDRATLAFSVDVENPSGSTVEGKVRVELGSSTLQVDLSLPGETCEEVSLGSLTLDHPVLWWPNGLGEAYLYSADFSAWPTSGGALDRRSVRFGVREVRVLPDGDGHAYFLVNGRRLFVRGGNWIASDAMYRLTARRYRDEVRLHAAMNMNLIRVWGGGLAERPEFYDACDEQGVLVWQEFWITGDCNGGGQGSPDYPCDEQLFLDSAVDTVRMLRNHPSLGFWVGGNEHCPRETLDEALATKIIPNLDGTRCYVSSSRFSGDCRSRYPDYDGFLGPGDGPYGVIEPEWYFDPKYWGYVFNPEVGSLGFPTLAGLRRILPASYGNIPVFKYSEDKRRIFEEKVDDAWTWHTYESFDAKVKQSAGTATSFDPVTNQLALYGVPNTPDVPPDVPKDERALRFCMQAQLAAYDQYRALIEGHNARMWGGCNGVLIWKSQNPWTGLRGSFYDWYLEQNGGYFGFQRGAERVHVQYNRHSGQVEVVNAGIDAVSGATLEGMLVRLDGASTKLLDETEISVAPGALKAYPISGLPKGDDAPYFLRLELTWREKEGVHTSRNFYWLIDGKGPTRFERLGELRDNPTRITASGSGTRSGDRFEVDVTLTNDGGGEAGAPGVAFWIQLEVFERAGSPVPVLPVFYGDNYLSLAPAESLTVHLSFELQGKTGGLPEIRLSGWNVASQVVKTTW